MKINSLLIATISAAFICGCQTAKVNPPDTEKEVVVQEKNPNKKTSYTVRPYFHWMMVDKDGNVVPPPKKPTWKPKRQMEHEE